MSKFLQDDFDNNDDAKAIAIPQVFSENSQTKNNSSQNNTHRFKTDYFLIRYEIYMKYKIFVHDMFERYMSHFKKR